MLILTIRTDKPESELGLYKDNRLLNFVKWEAHRQLAETIHKKLQDLLAENNLKLSDLKGVAVYKGPGSFTGLRIGLSVANALADSLAIPIVGETGNGWEAKAIRRLQKGQNQKSAIPLYGSDFVAHNPLK